MGATALQLVDSFLLNYNVGDALLVFLVLGAIGTLLKSRKVFLLHLLTFGLVFILTPASALAVNPGGSHLLGSALQYKLVGLALIVIAPIVWATSGATGEPTGTDESVATE
jgi:energy-converting hydrogenase Eha subunit C